MILARLSDVTLLTTVTVFPGSVLPTDTEFWELVAADVTHFLALFIVAAIFIALAMSVGFLGGGLAGLLKIRPEHQVNNKTKQS